MQSLPFSYFTQLNGRKLLLTATSFDTAMFTKWLRVESVDWRTMLNAVSNDLIDFPQRIAADGGNQRVLACNTVLAQ